MINGEIQEVNTNLVINKLSRKQYDELCASVPSQLNEFELYFVDDDNYDVFNKTIVNVGDPNPDKDNDGVNVGYVKTNYIRKTEIDDYIDKTKIYSGNGVSCMSSDGSIYCGELRDDSWVVTVISGSYTPNQISVFYNGQKGKHETDYGWAFNVNNGQHYIYTNDQNDKALIIQGEKEDINLKVSATRSVSWNYVDRFIRASELSNWLSCDTFAEFKQCVLNSLK